MQYVHSVAPRNITAAIGVQYFKQVFITWSIRSRGSVQRTHIITVTPNTHLAMKLSMPSKLPTYASDQDRASSRARPSQCVIGIGPFQPPKNRIDGQPADGEHRAVLGHEEEAPAQAGVFGVEAGHQFAFGFGQIERARDYAGRGAGEVDPERDERERVVKDEPVGEPARPASGRS